MHWQYFSTAAELEWREGAEGARCVVHETAAAYERRAGAWVELAKVPSGFLPAPPDWQLLESAAELEPDANEGARRVVRETAAEYERRAGEWIELAKVPAHRLPKPKKEDH